MIISEKIFLIIAKKKMSQKDFSARTGISQSTISDWKRKKTNPSADKILKICEVLQVTPYELLAEDNMDSEGNFTDYNVAANKDENKLLEVFRELDVRKQDRLFGYLDALMEKF